MDPDRFDILIRSLHHARSRRRALVTLLGLSGAAVVSRTELAEAKKKCSPCKKRKQGKCKKKLPDGTSCGGAGETCQSGSCVAAAPVPPFCQGKADNTDCGGGKKCSGGVCATPPPCTNGLCLVDGDCCSGSCDEGFFACDRGGSGKFCTSAVDCVSNTCVGFLCQ
jgi:hypothetical protein